ncbi:uncharacterized protein LOC113140248 [Mastacembelus armatus]|uniref:uncharacterized protein LOC113140248 n=1 Tax=Mastacembelus armatus TaxID=205130 RepID=UPI000E464B9C|nr:uncharacterized protein LOC113140248 [Mastacembelus armatus]XP_026179826.1 uncharacterized protein LOC113140248 [Mastacembelus armatus]XP_026179827.1 uncharacterized protein LOC113140248 [Mastacembelus armatus]
MVPSFHLPAVYTGKLIGIEYLYQQTGRAMQDINPDTEETDQMLEDVGTEEELEDEGFEDAGVDPTLGLLNFTTPFSDPSAATTSTAGITGTPIPLPTTSSLFRPAPNTLPALSASPATPTAPEQQLTVELSTSLPSVMPAVTTSASAPLLHTTLPVTVSTVTAAAPPGLPAIIPAVPEQHQAVDERGVPGTDRVDDLAEYLVGLRTQTGQTLSNQQVTTIVFLWQNLLPYDQQRVAYAARHQVRLTTGRYKRPKQKEDFTPGVESMTRCALGSTGSPAQWPDCSRLVEFIFVKLCIIHKSPKKQGSYALTRWTLILQDYSKIRQLVLGNGTVMDSTTLQLFNVNQTTLIQWHNKQLKRQDCAIILQGVNLPASTLLAPAPLPPGQVRHTAAPPHPGLPHQYHLPAFTVGQAVLKRRSAAPPQPCAPQAVRPRLQGQRQLFPRQALPPTSASVHTVLDPIHVITPPQFVRLQVPAQRPIAPAGPPPPPPPARRAYNRTVEKNKCGQCNHPRTKESGHSQYYGHIYCPHNSPLSLNQWMEDMRRKKSQKK